MDQHFDTLDSLAKKAPSCPRLGAVLRCVTWVAKDADWAVLEAWAREDGVDRVAGFLAACEAEVNARPLNRGGWTLYLLNPDPSKTSKSGIARAPKTGAVK